MYKGHHCTYQDYLRIQKSCDAFLHVLFKEENDYLLIGEKLYVEMLDYDKEIASRFLNILRTNHNKDALKKVIDELLRNVLVDMNEHK